MSKTPAPPLATRPDMEAFMVFDLEDQRATLEAWLPGANPHTPRMQRGLVWLCPLPGHIPTHDLKTVIATRFRDLPERVLAGGAVTHHEHNLPTGTLNDDARSALAELEQHLAKNGRLRRRGWRYITVEEWIAHHPIDPTTLLNADTQDLIGLTTDHHLDALHQHQVLHRPDLIAYLKRLRSTARREHGLPDTPIPIGQSLQTLIHTPPPNPDTGEQPTVLTLRLPDEDLPPDMPVATQPNHAVHLLLDLLRREVLLRLAPEPQTPYELPEVREGRVRAYRIPALTSFQEIRDQLNNTWLDLLTEVYSHTLILHHNLQHPQFITGDAAKEFEQQLREQIARFTPPKRRYATPHEWLATHRIQGTFPNLNAAAIHIFQQALQDGVVLHPTDILLALKPDRERAPPN